MLNALNEELRDDYMEDCAGGVMRWNRIIEKAGRRHPAHAAAQGVQPARSGAGAARRSTPPGAGRREASGPPASTDWLPSEADRAVSSPR